MNWKTTSQKKTQTIKVTDKLEQISGAWHSEFSFELFHGQMVSAKRLQDAMPLLITDYHLQTTATNLLIYQSKSSWTSEHIAEQIHRVNGLKLTNFGGHLFGSPALGNPHCTYLWRGVSRVALLPTLSSLLLMAFSLASITRYRPALLKQAMGSPVQVLLDTFVLEADGIYIPALRNLLYREELAVAPPMLM